MMTQNIECRITCIPDTVYVSTSLSTLTGAIEKNIYVIEQTTRELQLLLSNPPRTSSLKVASSSA